MGKSFIAKLETIGCKCCLNIASVICDALRDLIPFVQFKKREKHPWRSVNFSNNNCNFTKISTPPWVFFTFFKLFKWYQIAQRTTLMYSNVCTVLARDHLTEPKSLQSLCKTRDKVCAAENIFSKDCL